MKFDKNTLIYVVDDEEFVTIVICDLIQEMGLSAKAFTNPKEAIASLKTDQPALIISDFKMPEMDGIEFLQNINEIQQEIPVIFLSAYVSKDFIIKILENGGAGFLEKPIKEVHFRTTLKNALSKSTYLKLTNTKIVEMAESIENLEKIMIPSPQKTELENVKKNLNDLKLALNLFKNSDRFLI